MVKVARIVAIARDGRTLYALAAATGVLSAVDFPSGANRRTVAERVVRFTMLGDPAVAMDQGLGLFQDPRGALTTFAVRQAEGRTVTVADGVADAVVSRDTRFVHLTRAADATGRVFSSFVARTDGGGTCALRDQAQQAGLFPVFLDSAGLVLWAEEAGDDQVDGWLAEPADCGGQLRFAGNIGLIAPVGDRGVIYGDEVDDELVTLRYAKVDGGRRWPTGGGQVIRRNVEILVGGLVGGMERQAVFQVPSGPPDERGLFLYGPLP